MRRAKKKGTEVQRVKPLTPTRGIQALIGDEEQQEKIRKNKNKETGSSPSNQLHWPLGSILRSAGIIRWPYSFIFKYIWNFLLFIIRDFTSILDSILISWSRHKRLLCISWKRKPFLKLIIDDCIWSFRVKRPPSLPENGPRSSYNVYRYL